MVDFYCDECGFNSSIKIEIDTMGFDIVCPHCLVVWWFTATAQPPNKADLCDCGKPFPKNGYCKFCGARARYLEE